MKIAWSNLVKDLITRHDVFKNRNQYAHSILDDIGKHPNLYHVFPKIIFLILLLKIDVLPN